MTKRAAIRQADVSRVVRGAIAAGWAPGTFTVEVAGGVVRLLPIAANTPSDAAQDMEQRMREAFGES